MINIYQLNELHELLMPWLSYCPRNVMLTNLSTDSRNIRLGDLFIAIQGNKTDGRLYVADAIKKGAIAVLLESCDKTLLKQHIYSGKLVPIIYFDKLKKNISNISGRFYGYPSLFLNLIGVTGTNGKTTITHLLANWVELFGEKSAIVGTMGYGTVDNTEPSFCTTPAAIDIQRILTQFVHNKIQFVAIEVSSHGLDQYRVDALYFDVAIFSNLGYDHLDYHGNIKNYETAKWRLFNELHVEHYVINADDDIGVQWLSKLSKKSVAVVVKKTLPNFWLGRWICVIKVNYYLHGTDIIFNSSWGDGIIHTQLLGEFNVSNLLLALGTLLVLGYPLSCLLQTVSQLKPVCGRVEVFKSFNQVTIIIDYAHTPDALKKILSFIRQSCNGKIWCIFGCGGNRDKSKRALMGFIANQYANYIIITNDNPRTENPQSIINDIIFGIKYSKKIKIIQDRTQAINTVLSIAQPKDCVLILGKGHERFQIIGKNYINYSDHHVIKKFLINNI